MAHAVFCSSRLPFDEDSADFLEDLGVTAFKMPSGELTNLPFLEHIGRKGKPIILSTGMSTLEEVHIALQTGAERRLYRDRAAPLRELLSRCAPRCEFARHENDGAGI